MMSMANGKATFGGISSLVGKFKPAISSKESKGSVADVDALCKPTRAKLYGYDIGKNLLSDTVNKSRTFRISQAVSILTTAEGEGVMDVCRAFLKKFGFKNADVEGPIQKRIFFAGADKNENIKPQEIKYAVLRLLGLNESDAFNQVGMYRENSSDRLSLQLSTDFAEFVAQKDAERKLYPLEHPEEFTDVRNQLEELSPYIGSTDIKKIFNAGGIPQHVMQPTGEKTVSPLVNALSNLATALEHGISIGYLYLDSKDYPLPSFSSDIIALVEKKRTEKQTQKSGPEKPIG